MPVASASKLNIDEDFQPAAKVQTALFVPLHRRKPIGKQHLLWSRRILSPTDGSDVEVGTSDGAASDRPLCVSQQEF